VLHSLANYSNTIPSASAGEDTAEGDAPKPAQSANLGTLLGVYLPCIQNIFGVILFIRLTWYVYILSFINSSLYALLQKLMSILIIMSNCKTGLLERLALSAAF
jgi:hypothetical protein